MDLKAELKKIVELQNYDSQIHLFKHTTEIEIPGQLKTLADQFEEKKAILTSFEEKVKSLKLKRKEQELELASKEETARKAQGQLYQLKTNKEYQAKLTEIESLKADVSVFEEGIINTLDEIEQAEMQLKEAREVLAKEEKTHNEGKAKLDNQAKDLQAQIKNLTDKRTIRAKEADGKLLGIYERLLVSKGGVAIAPVINENCGACHMKVTAQKINEIKMYKDLIFCEACVRILYTQEDL